MIGIILRQIFSFFNEAIQKKTVDFDACIVNDWRSRTMGELFFTLILLKKFWKKRKLKK